MNPLKVSTEAQDLLSQGKFDQAIALLKQAIQEVPDNYQLCNLLAKAYLQQEQMPEAIACYRKAVELSPQSPEAHKNFGNAWLKQGNFSAAIACYQKAIELDPDYATAYYNLGLVFQRQEQLEAAIAHYRRAIELNPTDAAAYNNLGLALQSDNQPEAAIDCYQKLLEIDAFSLTTYHNLGLIFQKQENWNAARFYYEQALNLDANDVDTLNNLGFVLNELRQPVEAILRLQRAVTLNPSYVDAYVNLGMAYEKQDYFAEATACYQQALALNSDHPYAFNNLGVAQEQQGDFAQALACYERAIQLEPQRASYRWNRSLLLLRRGHLESGFAEFEARWQMKAIAPHSFPQPLWDGANLEGRSILLHSEGGFGDTLQFVRYAPLVAKRGGTVKVVAPQPLLHLLSTLAGVDQLISWEADLPDFDVHAPLMSLPHLFKTSLETIPASVPYLSPPKVLPFTLESPLNTFLKVGLTWGGNPEYGRDRSRSCSLQQFLPLLEIPEIAFYSLQKGPRAAELTEFPGEIALQNLSDRIHDFSDTAAVMAQLDLVITTDTSVAHLAGALGRPVWVLLNFVPDWRWLTEGDRSPWYPTMRLFRQTKLGNWSDVFTRVNQALQDLASQRALIV